MHRTAVFGGSRVAAVVMWASTEAGNSRLSGMYRMESPLARAYVPMCGCKGRQGLSRRASVPIIYPWPWCVTRDLLEVFLTPVMWLSGPPEDQWVEGIEREQRRKRKCETAVVWVKAHLKVLPLPGLLHLKGGVSWSLFQKHHPQLFQQVLWRWFSFSSFDCLLEVRICEAGGWGASVLIFCFYPVSLQVSSAECLLIRYLLNDKGVVVTCVNEKVWV